jgi:hypothetical protein
MRIKELITLLQQFNDNLTVKYSSSSKMIQMNISAVDVEKDINTDKDIVVILDNKRR